MRLAAPVALVLVVVGCSEVISVDSDVRQVVANAQPAATLELSVGRHEGPIVIDRPLTIIGEPGAVIVGRPGVPTVLIRDTDGVTLRGLAIEGGDSGIEVRDAESVVLQDIDVTGAALHGIFADDVEIRVTGCQVRGLRHPLAQGIEIINSIPRPASVVSGCTIYGPVFEGLVAHVSRVEFTDNVVTGSQERGIVITEMSSGVMSGNQVNDVIGSAYFCGDMSHCSVIGNSADGVANANDGWRSSAGHGLVVHFHSEAFVEDLEVSAQDGEPVLLMIDSVLVDERLEP